MMVVQKKNIIIFSKILKICKHRNYVNMHFIAIIESKIYSIKNIQQAFLTLDDQFISEIPIKQVFSHRLSMQQKVRKIFKIYHSVKINHSQLFNDQRNVNSVFYIRLKVEDTIISYPLLAKTNDRIKRFCYLPFSIINQKDRVCYFRKSLRYSVVCTNRLKEKDEKKVMFRIYESKLFSLFFLTVAKGYQVFSKKNINLYFEKESSKADEGVYDLFHLVNERYHSSKNYFVIHRDSEDYPCIKNHPCVLEKFSFKYYLVLYMSNNMISSEAPAHVNILRTKNRILKKSILTKNFFFLQHGIIYMKSLRKNTAFVTGKEAECKYILVSSEKEQAVVCKHFKMKPENVWVTGILMFDKIEWNSITADSEDIITIMLTWKPYEEHLMNFEESTYFQNTVEIYSMLKQYCDLHKICIVPHPKVKEQMLGTSFSELVYAGKISDALAKTKLLITDYSSVCYNSFYQGAGVVFYQEDLEQYEKENGKLIPNENEYVGYRVFNNKGLEELIKKGIENKKINLNFFRQQQFIDNYLLINEFHDGNNIDRVIKRMEESDLL